MLFIAHHSVVHEFPEGFPCLRRRVGIEYGMGLVAILKHSVCRILNASLSGNKLYYFINFGSGFLFVAYDPEDMPLLRNRSLFKGMDKG